LKPIKNQTWNGKRLFAPRGLGTYSGERSVDPSYIYGVMRRTQPVRIYSAI